MTVILVYRITFKQRNCSTLTIKQDKITHNKRGNEQWSFICWNQTFTVGNS